MSRRTLAAATIAIACCATCRADVDQSTPKATVKAFVQALVDGDADAIARLTIADADHQAAALALGRFSRAGLELESACQRRFHTTIRSDGNPKIRLDLPDPHGVDYARVEQADDRFATVLLDDGKNPYRVTRVGAAWRVDMTDGKDVRTPDDLRRIVAQSDAITASMTTLATKIDHGDVATVEVARNEFFFAMMQALRATPTTQATR